MSEDIVDRKPNKVILQPLDNPPKIEVNPVQSKFSDKDKALIEKKNVFRDDLSKKSDDKSMALSEKNLKSNNKNVSRNRLRVKRFMNHKIVQWFIIFLVGIYTLLIFSVLAIDDLIDEKKDKEDILAVLLYVESCILILFVLEITLTAYSQGLRFYFRDGWLVFDAVVIFLSIVFVAVFVYIDYYSKIQLQSHYKTITSMLRGIFRFVRIFLLIRKFQTFKKIKTSGGIRTASEKIMETLNQIKELIEITEILSDIDWAMEMIGSNKLYDPVYNRKGDEDDEWFNQYNYSKKDGNQDKGDGDGKKLKNKIHKIKPRTDKILATIPNKALQMFEKIDQIDFNCVELQKITKGQELSYLVIYLFEINDLYAELDINHKVLKNFILKIQNGYIENPYHNALHAFDVTQTVNFFLKKLKFQELAQITDLELCAMYISAAFHDYQHPGTNNPYQIAVGANLAIKYNDISVLEMHHVAASFELMQIEEYDIAQNFTKEDYRKFRDLCISIVLSTDMSKHFTDIAKIKGRLQQEEFDLLNKDKVMLIDAVVHASDISNPIKPWDVCYYWTEKLITGEFWSQGDKERDQGLPITYLCDRYTTNMAKSQGGFIDFVVRPLYEVIANVIPDLVPMLAIFDKNKESWNKIVPEFEEKLKILNEEKDAENGGKLE